MQKKSLLTSFSAALLPALVLGSLLASCDRRDAELPAPKATIPAPVRSHADTVKLPPLPRYPRDTTRVPVPRDTTRVPVPRDTTRVPVPRDTTRVPVPRDTTKVPRDTTRMRHQ